MSLVAASPEVKGISHYMKGLVEERRATLSSPSPASSSMPAGFQPSLRAMSRHLSPSDRPAERADATWDAISRRHESREMPAVASRAGQHESTPASIELAPGRDAYSHDIFTDYAMPEPLGCASKSHIYDIGFLLQS